MQAPRRNRNRPFRRCSTPALVDEIELTMKAVEQLYLLYKRTTTRLFLELKTQVADTEQWEKEMDTILRTTRKEEGDDEDC